MPDDLESMFNEAADTTPEVEDGDLGDFGSNATINTGEELDINFDGKISDTLEMDDEVSDETSDDSGSETELDTDDGATDGEVLDWATQKDKLVEVKVNGETVKVPLGDALNGYMRQEDYTRKTQAIAASRADIEWAQDMKRALQVDPAGTLRSLSAALGVDVGDVEDDPYAELDEPTRAIVTRQDRELQEARAFMERQEQERIRSEVRAEIDSVRSEFSDFDAAKVLPLAAEKGLAVRDAYMLLKSNEWMSAQKAETVAKEKARQRASAEAKKRSAGGKIATGGSGSRATSDGVPPKLDSFEDMLEFGFSQAS